MKKNIIIVAVLLLIGSLVACSSLSFTSSSTTTRRSSNTSTVTDPTKLTVEAKTGIGILKLEGTEQAVDTAKAKELLPLFLALKTLSTNNNTAVDEITALNRQIKNTLSAEQLSAIQDMTFTSADLRSLMETNGLLDASATSSTSSKTSSSQAGGMGGPPDSGIPGMGGPGGVTTTSKTQATPNAAASALSARKVAGGLNLTFAEPIIKLLQSKISQ